MTLFWTLAVALCVVAAAFIVLPLYIRRKETSAGSRTTVNLGIYEERLGELQESFDAGDINQEEFDHLKTELQKNLVTDSEEQEVVAPTPAARPFIKVPAALAVLVPVFALIAYADWGLSWGAIEDYQIARDLNNASPHDQQDMGGAVRRLEKSLASQPDNHQGWFLLGQSYMSMG
ncbi:MAG: c-type cytochrome biogenesis protein CcmI, partial [Pseudomonadales bacterium]|nr:c-type cytochrome biogenesis protein CcmI [Pseudomonadales bacterium]